MQTFLQIQNKHSYLSIFLHDNINKLWKPESSSAGCQQKFVKLEKKNTKKKTAIRRDGSSLQIGKTILHVHTS